MLKENKGIYITAAHFLIWILAVIIIITFRDYGISWDEEVQNQYGQAIYNYYISGFTDRSYNQIFNLYLYGGMFDGLAAWINAYTPFDIYATRHLLNAFVGLLGLWGAWRLGRLIGGERVGFFTLFLLAMIPMYYGHMFNNPKDIPFAAGVVWTLYFMTKTLRAFPSIRWSLILKLAIVMGLTMGIRVGGIMLMGYWIVALEAMAFSILWNRLSQFNDKQTLKLAFGFDLRLLCLIVPVVVLSYAVMLICWPWAQESPIANPLKALIQFSNFPNYVEVLLNGITYPSTELPWYYLPVYFGVQLPLPHLALIICGIVLLPSIWRNLKVRANRYSLLLILLTAFVPIAFAIIKRPALYDAVRHFIFTLPLLCLFSALALERLLITAGSVIQNLNSKPLKIEIKTIIGLISFIVIATHIHTYAKLHPYEYIYINPIGGGVKGAYGRYELDYWGSSFKEAAKKLQEYVDREGGISPGKIVRVAICGPWSGAMIYLPPNYGAVVANEPAEFFLSTTRWQCHNMREGKEIARVERLGVPLSIVKDLRHEPDYQPEQQQ